MAKVKKAMKKKPIVKVKAKAKFIAKGKAKLASKKPAAKKVIAKKKLIKKAPVKKSVAKSVAKPVAKVAAPVNRRPAGLPEQLRDAALKILDERQAEEIITFDLAGRSSVADYLIVASGRAGRQLAAIAQYLSEAFSKLGVQRTRVEGLQDANWVLIDGGDVIVHLFLPEVRGFYNLEGIWSRKA